MLSRLYCVVLVVIFSCVANCQNPSAGEKSKTQLAKFVKCDPEKVSSKPSECPPNSICVELGKGLDGLCACQQNYTVNDNYTPSSDSNGSAYCVERNSTTTPMPPTPTPMSSTTTKQVATEVPTRAPLKTTTTPMPLPPPTTTHAAKVETTTKSTTAGSETTTRKNKIINSTPSSHELTTAKVETTALPSNEPVTAKNKTEIHSAQPQGHHFFGGIILPLMFVLAFVGAAYGVKKYNLIERAQTYVRNRRATGQPHQTSYEGLENDFDDDPLLI